MIEGGLINLLLSLLIGGLIVYAIYWFIDLLALPAPFNTIIKVIVAVVALVWLLRLIGFSI